MIALLYATALEAAPLLARFEKDARSHRRLSDTLYLYDFERSPLAVALVGMGKSAAAAGTQAVIRRLEPAALINLGIAGGLSEHAVVGGIFAVRHAVDWPHAPNDPVPFDVPTDDSIPLSCLDLVTSDAPVFDDVLREKLKKYGDMVDMEGSAIARAAITAKLPCRAIKVISDEARDGHRETLRKNIGRASEKLAELVAQMRVAG